LDALVSNIVIVGVVASFPDLVAYVGLLVFHSEVAVLDFVSSDPNCNLSIFIYFTLPVDCTASDRLSSSSGIEEGSECNVGFRASRGIFPFYIQKRVHSSEASFEFKASFS